MFIQNFERLKLFRAYTLYVYAWVRINSVQCQCAICTSFCPNWEFCTSLFQTMCKKSVISKVVVTDGLIFLFLYIQDFIIHAKFV